MTIPETRLSLRAGKEAGTSAYVIKVDCIGLERVMASLPFRPVASMAVLFMEAVEVLEAIGSSLGWIPSGLVEPTWIPTHLLGYFVSHTNVSNEIQASKEQRRDVVVPRGVWIYTDYDGAMKRARDDGRSSRRVYGAVLSLAPTELNSVGGYSVWQCAGEASAVNVDDLGTPVNDVLRNIRRWVDGGN